MGGEVGPGLPKPEDPCAPQIAATLDATHESQEDLPGLSLCPQAVAIASADVLPGAEGGTGGIGGDPLRPHPGSPVSALSKAKSCLPPAKWLPKGPARETCKLSILEHTRKARKLASNLKYMHYHRHCCCKGGTGRNTRARQWGT